MNETNDENSNSGDGTPPGPGRVRWEMTHQDGCKEMIFEDELALAALLMSEVVFTNSHWWQKDWPEAARKTTSLNVNCNDVFAWGCADAEEMAHEDIETVYDHWQKDPSWGTAIWCMIKRKEMPQRPVQKLIEDGGKWDFNELCKMHGLRANHYDGVSRVIARLKYSAYSSWAVRVGKVVLPFDPQWWSGWKEYTDANPDWNCPEWKAEEDAALDAWKTDTGWV